MGGYIGATAVGLTTTAADVQGDITSTDTTPELILKNTSEEDTEGGREGKITFKGEQSGGEETTLAQIQASHDGTSDDEKGDLIFKTNDGSDGASPTEAARIDSGRTLLIGKTEDGFSNAGHALFGGGDVYHIKDGNAALYAKRLSSQGDIAKFYIDSTHVGTIGTEANDLTIFTPTAGHNGIRLHASGILPTDNTGSIIDADADFGTLAYRFKDLYLSSGIKTNGNTLDINAGTANVVASFESTDTEAQINLVDTTGSAQIRSRNDLRFYVNGGSTRAADIDSSGNLVVGETSTSNVGANTGAYIASNGQVFASSTSSHFFNRTSSDGDIVTFRRANTTQGSIGYGARFYIADTTIGFGFDAAGTDNILPCDDDGGLIDNGIDLGVAAARFDDIFATNTSIQTSDEREKQQIASLTNAEITAATAISKLFKTYKWNDSVAENGDNARTHTGVVAQQVEQAMTDAGLDASKYAFWCSDTWWETQTEVAAVEADEENGIEAKDSYTRTDHYWVAEEAPEGATERNRKGIRYPELLSFIGAATEQRLTSIEARLDALEG